MVRKTFFYTTLITIAFMITGFKAAETRTDYSWFRTELNSKMVHFAPTKDQVQKSIRFPFVGKNLVAFKQAMAFRESNGRYGIVNTLGYMGKYQFGESTLNTVGVYNPAAFLNSPVMQEKAFNALLALNKWYLRKEIAKYSGTVIQGVTITESGILAAAHLGGAGGVRKYLRTNGVSGFKDGYGTSMRSYLKKFGGYDTSDIIANKKARVRM